MLSVKEDWDCFKANDSLNVINGQEIQDIIDLRFYTDDDNIVGVARNGEMQEFRVSDETINSLKFKQDIPDVKKCLNDCVFCFLKQLPKGLRQTLYFKDDDWRLSFLCGNFITLTNISETDLNRIIRQRILPLYVSIHSTDAQVREKLGLKKQDRGLKALKTLDKEGIETHLQIVLCPGINDGSILRESLENLSEFKHVKSVGIVPLGLTKYHRNGLRSFTDSEAKEIIKSVGSLRAGFCAKRGENWVYLADEFYLLADMQLPKSSYYDDFYQLENGIGLARRWLNQIKNEKLKIKNYSLKLKKKKGKPIFLTGKLFEPLLKESLGSLGLEVKIQAIENNFFGPKITVAGLITARDIIKQVKPTKDPILIPDIMINDDKLFLDNISFSEIKKSLPSAVLVPSTGKLFASWLSSNFSPITHYGLRTTVVS